MALPVKPDNPNAGTLVKFDPLSKTVTLTFNGKNFKITQITQRKDGVEKTVDPNSIELDKLAQCCEQYFNLIKPTIADNSEKVSFTFKQNSKDQLELRQIEWVNPGGKKPHIQEIVPNAAHQPMNATVTRLVQHLLQSKKRKTPEAQNSPLLLAPALNLDSKSSPVSPGSFGQYRTDLEVD